MKRSLVIGLVLIGLALTGCGPGSAGSLYDNSLPAGIIRETAEKAGLSVGIDQHWTIGDPLPGSDIAFAADQKLRIPIPLPTHRTRDPIRGFSEGRSTLTSSSSIEVRVLPASKQTPTSALTTPSDGTSRTTIGALQHVSTPVGAGRLVVADVHYLPNGPVVYSEQLFIDRDHRTILLSATGLSRAAVDHLMKATIPTLRTVG